MGKNNWIIECLFYLESHLKETLTLEEISAYMGYSPWYFSRCFKEDRGVSLMEYVKQRRLFIAAREIRQGKKILDTALEYGWQTHSGFTKAFHNQFGYTPALLRAFYVHDVSLKGEKEIMKTYLKASEQYKQPEELWEMMCITLKENGIEYENENLRRLYQIAYKAHKGEKVHWLLLQTVCTICVRLNS